MNVRQTRVAAAAALAALVGLCGCSQRDAAIRDAKKDVKKTGRTEEVMYTDGRGDVSTTLISPAPAGASAQTTVTSATTGGAIPTGLPDWSNGHPPERRQAARYTSPGHLAVARQER